MPSPESYQIRKTLVKGEIDNTPIAQKRKQWDNYAKIVAVPEGVRVHEEYIGGIFCLCLKSQEPLNDYIMVHMHGGGLTEGSIFTAREWTARLAKTTRVSFLSSKLPFST